jgi:GT2 family glycosyltransferase
MNHELVSIIIVNWNAKDFLKPCLDSIYSQSYQNFEIILVDNNSKDDSLSFVRKNFPKVKIIENKENVGFAEGNNIGFKQAKGNLIAMVNPDAELEQNWLSLLVSVLESSEEIAAASGKIFYLDGKNDENKIFCTWSKINTFSATPVNFYHNEPLSEVDYLSGSALIFKKNVLEKIGLLDKTYFLYFEETDWCARIIRLGYKLIYVPNAIAWHAVSPLSKSDEKIYYMERGRVRFALKNFDIPYIFSFSLIFFGETIFLILRDIKKRNFLRTKLRLKAIYWNFINFKNTINSRKEYMSILKKNGIIHSYNKNLPLRLVKIKN